MRIRDCYDCVESVMIIKLNVRAIFLDQPGYLTAVAFESE